MFKLFFLILYGRIRASFYLQNMLKLKEEEIRQRLKKLHNYEHVLYPELKERSDKLRLKNKELKLANAELRQENKQIEKILLELEELREMIYGKKQKERRYKKVSLPGKDSRKGEKPIPRSPESYRRTEPKEEEITGEIKYELSACPSCGDNLVQKQEHTHYREDLDGLDLLLAQAKKVTKRIIESGYCKTCKKRKRALDIPEQKVTIGQNMKATIVYLHVLLGLSYREIKEYLKVHFDFELGAGMISKSLEEQADLLRPFYQKIYQDLLNEKGCHYDESIWKIQGESEGNYVWGKIGMESDKVIFWFGQSRGKGVAKKLRGEITKGNVKNQVGVSDDYASYWNLFTHHQLCWAHPHRKIRDLAESTTLEESIRKHCEKVYKQYAKLYKQARQAKQKFDSGGYKTEAERQKVKDELKVEFDKLTIPHNKDPDKLRRIRASLRARKEKYFVFMRIKGTPLDNNKAERALRRVVLRRKKSFGSKSQKGANTLSILYSVVFSIYWSHPSEKFFKHYEKALGLNSEKPQ